MRKGENILTDTALRFAKARGKPYKLYDGSGLHLLVTSTGSRLWRLKFNHGGKEGLLALGRYPEIGLADARAHRDQHRRALAKHQDPRKAAAAEEAASATFESIAREWLGLQAKEMKPSTYVKAKALFESHIFPHIGQCSISKLEPPDLLPLLRKLESADKRESAHRARQRIGKVMRFAIATGRAKRDATADLKDALAPIVSTNHPAITDPRGVGELLRAIDGYSGQIATATALKLLPIVFLRMSELRKADWSEIDLKSKEPTWRVPISRMKGKRIHVVPLARQAVDLLTELHKYTGPTGYVFPAIGSRVRPLSENTIGGALRRLGYTPDQQTPHGFRTIFSTLANELDYSPDLIELQLSHIERNKTRAAYNKAQKLPARRQMMQCWADYLEELRLCK